MNEQFIYRFIRVQNARSLSDLQIFATNNCNFDTLYRIHKIIFEDIYEWAGQIRTGDFFSKGGSIFCRGQLITENANIIMENLKKENYLQ